MQASDIVLTDSGGVPEDVPSLGKPVLVMRETTERPEAVVARTVKLAGTDEDLIVSEVSTLLTGQSAYEGWQRPSTLKVTALLRIAVFNRSNTSLGIRRDQSTSCPPPNSLRPKRRACRR